MKLSLTRNVFSITLAALLGATWAFPALAAPALSGKLPKAKPAVSPEWLPDPDLVLALGSETSVGSYRMRLPLGVAAEVKTDHTDGGTRTTLLSLHRADSAGPSIYVFALSFAPGQTPPSAQQLMDSGSLLHPAADITKLVVSPLEYGQIHGLQAVRQYFKRMKGKQQEHGFQYVVADGVKRTMFVAVDDEPYSKTNVPLAEAAVLTFHK